MKNTKRILAILLIAAMACSMAACSSINTLIQQGAAAINSANEKEVKRGVVNGQTYKNESLGIQCTLDDSWTISDEDELAQLAGLTAAQFESESIKTVLEKSSIFFDFYASKDMGLESININMNQTESSGSVGITEETLASAGLKQFTTMLQETGLTDCDVVQSSITLAGIEHPCYNVTATISGYQIYEKVVMILQNNVVISITACSYMEDQTDAILAMFIPC